MNHDAALTQLDSFLVDKNLKTAVSRNSQKVTLEMESGEARRVHYGYQVYRKSHRTVVGRLVAIVVKIVAYGCDNRVRHVTNLSTDVSGSPPFARVVQDLIE